MVTRDENGQCVGHEALLDALGTYGVLTAELAAHAVLSRAPSRSQLRRVQEWFARLAREDMVRRTPMASVSPGRKAFVYWRARKPGNVDHALGVRAACIHVTNRARREGVAVSVVFGLHMPGILPDASLVLERDGRRALRFVEHDTGTEGLPALVAKARAYLAALDAGAQHALVEVDGASLGGFRVLFVLESKPRLERLAGMLDRLDERGVFWMATLDGVRQDGAGRAWRVTGSRELQPLVRTRRVNPSAINGVMDGAASAAALPVSGRDDAILVGEPTGLSRRSEP